MREKELLANVSHELRTPLARIRVALDLAAEGDPQVARQLLVEIADDLGELEQLISDVLGIPSRFRAIEYFRDERHLSAAQGARRRFRSPRQVCRRFRSAHPDRPLIVEAVGHATMVEGDAVLLRRALQNVLENAHKYTNHPNAPIHLKSGIDASSLWIEVRDQGIGIAPDDLRHVFLPFFRSDKSRTRATGGFGLGLAIVKQIAEAHQGNVAIESEIGAGTRVRIRLPAVAAVRGLPEHPSP